MNDYSESSFSSSGNLITEDTRKVDASQFEEVKQQNQQLREQVQKLQNSLNSTNEKLNLALASSSSVQKLNDEITSLKQKLKETTSNNNQIQKQLREQLTDITTKYDEAVKQYSEQNEAQSKEIIKTRKNLRELQSQRNILATDLDETKQQLQFAVEKMAKLSKQKSKAQNQIKQICKRCYSYDKKYNALVLVHDSLIQENKANVEAAERNQQKVDALTAENQDLKSQIQNLEEKNKNLGSAFEMLQKQMESQKDDISQLIGERGRFISLIHKLHSFLCSVENELTNVREKNEMAKEKQKKQKALAKKLQTDKYSLETLNYPFPENVKQRIQKIISDDHFQQPQKLQLIFNELSKDLRTLREDNASLTKSGRESTECLLKVQNDSQHLSSILNSLLRQWKNLEFNERKINDIAFCNEDTNFLSFIAEATSNNARSIGGVQFPMDILSDDAVDQRRQLLKEIGQKDQQMSSLVSMLFLINTRLKKQVDELTEGAQEKQEITEVLNSLGVDSINNVPEIVEDLQNQVMHLKSTRKEAHLALVAARDEINAKEQEQNQFNAQKEALNKQIEDLTKENEELRSQLRNPRRPPSRSSCLANDYNSNNNSAAASVMESDSDNLDTIQRLQEELQQKVVENKTLRDQLDAAKREVDRIKYSRKRQATKREQVLLTQIQDLEDALRETCNKLVVSKKKAKSQLNQTKDRAESELDCIKKQYEQERLSLTQELARTKEKAENYNNTATKLQDSLLEEEKKNKELTESNTSLKKLLQTLEAKVGNIQEQFARSQKSAQAEHAVKVMNIEAKHQKEMKDTKSKLEDEKEKAISFFTQHIGALYNLGDLDYDEQSLMQVFTRLQSDLSKLKYFQEQATKM